MTGLPITVCNIRSQIPGFVEILQAYGDAEIILKGLEPHLGKMASSDGMNCVINGRPTKVHIGWSYDGEDKINGLFASSYQEDPYGIPLQAFKMVEKEKDSEVLLASSRSVNHIVQNDGDSTHKQRFIGRFMHMDGFFNKGKVTPYDGEITFEAQWLDQGKVRDFYKKNQAILDNLIQNSPSPASSAPTEMNDSKHSADTDMRKYLYLGGVLLLVLVVAYYVNQQGSFSTST